MNQHHTVSDKKTEYYNLVVISFLLKYNIRIPDLHLFFCLEGSYIAPMSFLSPILHPDITISHLPTYHFMLFVLSIVSLFIMVHMGVMVHKFKMNCNKTDFTHRYMQSEDENISQRQFLLSSKKERFYYTV